MHVKHLEFEQKNSRISEMAWSQWLANQKYLVTMQNVCMALVDVPHTINQQKNLGQTFLLILTALYISSVIDHQRRASTSSTSTDCTAMTSLSHTKPKGGTLNNFVETPTTTTYFQWGSYLWELEY